MSSIPFLVAALVILVIFISAVKNGVVKILTSGFAAGVAFVVLFGITGFLPALMGDSVGFELKWPALLGIGLVAAVIVYIISLLVFKAIFRFIFGPDSPLHNLSDGFFGGILSLFPSLIVVFFVFLCLRVAGTVQELNYVASVSQPNISSATNQFPAWPKTTVWRNQMESVPGVAAIYDLIDPFSRRENRNLASILLMKQRVFVSNYLGTRDDTIELVEDGRFEALMEDDRVYAKLKAHDRVGLVMNSDLRREARDSEWRSNLQNLKVRSVVEGLIELLPGASMKE